MMEAITLDFSSLKYKQFNTIQVNSYVSLLHKRRHQTAGKKGKINEKILHLESFYSTQKNTTQLFIIEIQN